MTLVRANRNRPLLSTWFDDNFLNDFATNPAKFNPAVNISENSKSYELELSVPGMHKKDFEINLDSGELTISAHKVEENEENEKNYTRREFKSASFSRSFVLPEGKVDENKIEASYKDGILKINIPKKEEATPKSKLISIK